MRFFNDTDGPQKPGHGQQIMENCTEAEGAFSWADQVRTEAFAWAGGKVRKGASQMPQGTL